MDKADLAKAQSKLEELKQQKAHLQQQYDAAHEARNAHAAREQHLKNLVSELDAFEPRANDGTVTFTWRGETFSGAPGKVHETSTGDRVVASPWDQP